MNKIILTDTCFWLGLIDSTDQHHEKSKIIEGLISNYELIFPWPCLYETISTRLVRRRDYIIQIENILSKSNVIKIEDNAYKESALKYVFDINRNIGHTYSLADSVIRELLKDINIHIDYFVTYNERDFKDICDQRRIEIFSGED